MCCVFTNDLQLNYRLSSKISNHALRVVQDVVSGPAFHLGIKVLKHSINDNSTLKTTKIIINHNMTIKISAAILSWNSV